MIDVSEKTTVKISLTLLVSTFIAVVAGAGFAIRVDTKLNSLIDAEKERNEATKVLIEKQVQDRMDIIRIKAHLKIGSIDSVGSFDSALNR